MNTITYKKFVQFKNSPNDKEGEKDENKRGRIFPYIQYFSQIKTFTWIWENNEKKWKEKGFYYFLNIIKARLMLV